MIRLVSFDVWGTILRTNPDYRQNQRLHLQYALGYSGDTASFRRCVQSVYAILDRQTERDGKHFGARDRVDLLASRLGVPRLTDNQFGQLLDALTALQYQYMPRLTDDSLDHVMARLKSDGMKLAVISNTNMTEGAVVHEALDHHGLAQYLDHELYSDVLGFAKPDPRIYDELMNQTQVRAAEIVHIGDNLVTDVRGPRAAGFGAILYDRRQRFRQSSEVIWSFEELLDTDHLKG